MKILAKLTAFSALTCSITLLSAAPANNITGLWVSDQDKTPNAIIIHENMKNHSVEIMGAYPTKQSGMVVWSADGKIVNNHLTAKYEFSSPFSHFEPGFIDMTLSKDGSTLTGDIRSKSSQYKVTHAWSRQASN